MDQNELIEILKAGFIEWRKHVFQRLAEPDITQDEVIHILTSGEQIEDYSDDKPYPCALFLGWIEDKPLHVLVILDEMNRLAYIITAYEPSLEYFEFDFKTRRKKPG